MGGAYDFGYIFELSPGTDGWTASLAEGWGYTLFPTSGALGFDSSGNLYGTTAYCGTNDQGTVWKLVTQ